MTQPHSRALEGSRSPAPGRALRAAPAPAAAFTLDQAQQAWDAWGANCGPGALAAVLGLSLDAVRPHLGAEFERKRYTNPLLMFSALRSAGATWQRLPAGWPTHGLARVQWEGPWTAPGVPMRVRYRHTHWVASRSSRSGFEIFDINAICAGGWLPVHEWEFQLVPWLLRGTQPKAAGGWHLTHRLEVFL